MTTFSKQLRYLALVMGFLGISSGLWAQVEFKVELLPDETTYQVSLLPAVSWPGVMALTSTAQVTLVAPSGGFTIANLQSVSGTWSNNSNVLSPLENPNFDYLTVGMVSLGTLEIEYTSGQETVLFTFENSGVCTGAIELFESNDPFTPPNSASANVGNQLTTLGSGNTNAWTGNIEQGMANCSGGGTDTFGCTDETACNFNPDANMDDGSCDEGEIDCPDPCSAIVGCTDNTAVNFDAEATCDDGSCIPAVLGCTNETACNFNPNANADDGSCDFGIAGCPDPCNAMMGCTDNTAINFDNTATCDDGSCIPTVLGCTDNTACNFNPSANTDDNSCDAGVEGCPDPCNAVLGCTDNTAINFDASATCDDDSCIPTVLGCTANTACNFNPNANSDDGSCDFGEANCPDPCNPVLGCTDNNDINYNPNACVDDGSCGGGIVEGCTDATACNFNPNANTDDGSCEFGVAGCPDPCNAILGCTDNTAINFDATATCDDDSCVPSLIGCTDATACNFNPNANTDDGSCEFGVAGCPDPCNAILGCTDNTAINFNPLATCDDASCTFDPVIDPEITFIIEKDENDVVTVSLMPNVTWTLPNNMTSTAQVSLLVPAGGFELGNFQNINGTWEANAIINMPVENPGFDYINVGLTSLATPDIEYTANVATPLFSFENIGTCVETIDLMENSDPFFPPNTISANVGNQITTLGSGNINAWSGNVGNVVCECAPVIEGCTDMAACNFDANATIDDGSCESGEIGCPDPCNAVLGCTDNTAINFDAVATCDDDSCIPSLLGCTDATACNFNTNANTDDGSCEFGEIGCLDPCNAILGCTDDMATNYNPNATCDDASCDFTPVDNAEITFTIEKDENDVVTIFMTPNVTWTIPNNLTSTAQVTIVVPTGGFEAGNLLNINGVWAANSIIIAPEENPNFDYINFGLTSLGTTEIEYVANVMTPLFSFENVGECVQTIDLIEDNDPFLPPNSTNSNVGNQITTLGSGNVNAWVGNIGNVICACSPTQEGCTDNTACNFNPVAIVDDGSCEFGVAGCPDPCNAVLGCTDTAADNFNPLATCENGNCMYLGCIDATACNFDTNANTDDGSCEFGVTGCPDPCNPIMGCTDSDAINYNPDACEDDGSCGGNVLAGCTNETACNFDSNANTDDGSCEFGVAGCPDPCNPIMGCTDSDAINYNPNACEDDGSCGDDVIEGCTNETACNFDSNANVDDGSCDFGETTCPDPCNAIMGCTDNTAINFDATATCDDDSCIPTVMGCTNISACNFNPDANMNDGSCDFGETGCPNPCNAISGCTDNTAINFDANATCDDGSCIDPLVGCTNPDACNYSPTANTDDGSCDFGVASCPDPCNAIMGCTDNSAINFNPNATCDDDSCIPTVMGCTNTSACNFDPAANTNDGSCDFGAFGCADPCNAVLGCIDPLASNYNPNATCSDGSCDFTNLDAPCQIATVDLIISQCGTCTNEITLNAVGGFANGTNQWLFELYPTGNLNGNPIKVDATKFPPITFNYLCSGLYSVRIIGLAGSVAGCYQEITNIAVNPSCGDNDDDGVFADTDPDDSDPCVPNANSIYCTDSDNDGVFADTDPDDSDPCVPITGPDCFENPVIGEDCGIQLGFANNDCGLCNGSITIFANGLSNGVNQWFFELYRGSNFSGDLLSINATKNPPEVYKNLCAGTYSVRVVGLAGDVAGCVAEFGQISLGADCPENPDTPDSCEPMELIYACTEPLTPLTICLSECDDVQYSISDASSAFDCSIQILSDNCIRYMPLPGFEAFGLDEVIVEYCFEDGNCGETVAMITVGDCANFGETVVAIDDFEETDENEAVNFNPGSNDGGNGEVEFDYCNEAGDLVAENGAVSVNGDGTMTYTPNAGFTGIDVFTYTICGVDGSVSDASVTITVKEGCSADMDVCTLPFPYPETIICVDFCAYDMEINTFETATECTLEQISKTCFSYRAAPDFAGIQIIAVTGCDDQGNCETMNVNIDVNSECEYPGTERLDNSGDSESVFELLRIPNVFTPNNDGINDVFNVAEVSRLTTGQMTVFDRNGRVMFETTDLTIGWDGVQNNYNDVPNQGTYFYNIKLTIGDKVHTKTGFIELRR